MQAAARPSRLVHHLQGAEYFRVSPRSEPGRVHPGLRARNLLQILAEPNLVTTNGKEASFLVGGEFPGPGAAGRRELRRGDHPVSRIRHPAELHPDDHRQQHHQHARQAGSLRRSITPTRCRSTASPSPRLSTRKMETNVELGEGQSFVVAGLVDNRETETLSQDSGLVAAFRSWEICSRAKEIDQERHRADRDGDAGDHHAAAAGDAKPSHVDARGFPGAPVTPG